MLMTAFNLKSIDCQSLCNLQKGRVTVSVQIHLLFY